jgi:hypothetical protein
MITRHYSDLTIQLRLEHEVDWHVSYPDPRCFQCAEELADEDEAYRRNTHPSLAGSAA